jgi:hypothetical protein
MDVRSLQTGVTLIRRERTYMVRSEDLTAPLIVLRDGLQTLQRQVNLGLMHVRHSLRQRTNIRLTFDCLVRRERGSTYKRLSQMSARLSCPTPEQAELAIDAILAFAQSLDGKWLAPRDAQATDQPNVSGLGADSPAIGEGLARADLTAAGELEETAAPPTPPLKSPDRGERD